MSVIVSVKRLRPIKEQQLIVDVAQLLPVRPVIICICAPLDEKLTQSKIEEDNELINIAL